MGRVHDPRRSPVGSSNVATYWPPERDKVALQRDFLTLEERRCCHTSGSKLALIKEVYQEEKPSVTGDGQRTVTPAENNSETQSRGPEEAGAHQVLLGFAEARWGREVELLRTPINCCFRGCAPEFGRFRERVAEPPGHLVCQSWGTSCENLKLLPLKRN